MNFWHAPIPILLALAALQSGEGARPAPGTPAIPAEGTPFETLTRKLPDEILMTADLYRLPGAENASKPVLVCFHMTGSSRGEYRKLAPRLGELGFHVLAADLRFGGEGEFGDRRTKVRSGTMNETWKMAKAKLGREITNVEAYPDVVEATKWARELFPRSRLGLIGSSYSASLVLVCAAEHPRLVDAVVALSPGEYFERFPIAEKVRGLAVPTYITCGNTLADSSGPKAIAAAIERKSILRTYFPADEGGIGDHGTRALLIQEEPDRTRQWTKLNEALEPLRQPVVAVPSLPEPPTPPTPPK